MAKPIHIPKPLAIRTLELIQGLLVLRDSIEKIKKGGRNAHQFIPIYGQLRALLYEKSKKNKSLLLDLAKILKQPLELWCMRPADVENYPALVLCVSGFPVSVYQQFSQQEKITIENFLNHKFLYYNKQHYTVSDVINYFANHAGGAHFATKIRSDFSEILSLNIDGQPGLFNFLLQIAEVTYELGLRLLKRLNDIELHLAAFIPEQDINSPKYIFDTRYPDTPMRASVLINQDRKLLFRVTGIDGVTVQVASDRLIDFTRSHYFSFLYQIDKKLSTNISISVDGETFGEVSFPFPIFFVNEFRVHETFHNRAVDDEKAGIKYAMICFAVTDPEFSFIERYRVFVHIHEMIQDDAEPVVYLENSYAYSKPGTTDLTLMGDFYKSSLRKLREGDWNKPSVEEGDKVQNKEK